MKAMPLVKFAIPAVLIGVVALLAAGTAQPVSTTASARPVVPAPSVALLVGLAYPALLEGKAGPHPVAMRALKRELAKSPQARRAFAQLYASYRRLPEDQRRTLLGPLAGATTETRLSTQDLRRSLVRPGRPLMSSSQLVRSPNGERARRTGARPSEPGTREAEDPNNRPPGMRGKRKEHAQFGSDPLAGLKGKSQAYRVAYKGMYLTGTDETTAEPYVLFVLSEGSAVWTNRVGPFSMEALGKSYRDITLRSKTTFQTPLSMFAIGWENDNFDPDDAAAAVNVIVTVACVVSALLDYPCPAGLTGLAKDIITWLTLQIDPDDLVGFTLVQMTAQDAFNKNWTGSTTDPDSGHVKDFWLLFDSGAYRYWVAIDAVPVN